MSDVFFVDKSSPRKIPGVVSELAKDAFAGAEVMVKLNMGERGNKWYVKPDTVRIVTDELRKSEASPFIYDTVIVYGGQRNTHDKYTNLAVEHGFDKIGCPVVIGDKGRIVPMDEEGIAFRFEVAEQVLRTGHIVSIVHAKGSSQTGFAGTLKNVGMGGVSKSCKLAMHAAAIKKALTPWGRGPLTFNKVLALAAKACLAGKRLLCFHVLLDITTECDCRRNALPIVCPDLGYLLSTDPVAVEAASIEMILEHGGPGAFKRDPWEQVEFAEKIGLGSRAYGLVRI